MSASSPRVTVLLTVYNGSGFLDQTIASVVSQDFRDIEILIVDDASTDDSPALIAAWAQRDERIVVARTPRNGGAAHAINHGLALARAPYVTQQDQDDLCMPGRLRRQVEILDRDPEVAMVAADYELIDAQGNFIVREHVAQPHAVIAYLLNFSNAIGGHSQVMYRRDAVRALGGYDERYRGSSDYDLWTRLLASHRCVVLPIVGMRHRMHGGRLSVRHGAEQSRNSREIAKRALEAWLGRTLAPHEREAIESMWRQDGRRGIARDAQRVLAEAYRRFEQSDPEPEHRRRVREVTAHRWCLSAARMLLDGHVIEAIVHLTQALRWSVRGTARGLRQKARALLRRSVGALRGRRAASSTE